MLLDFFGDLHIHIGRSASGAPVKITASKGLTLSAILKECRDRKGVHIAGIVDCASPPVLKDIGALIGQGHLTPLEGGGLVYENALTIILGAEIELAGPRGGSAHFLAYVPTLEAMEELSNYLAKGITNISLSSQRAQFSIEETFDFVTNKLQGIFLPAHAFTPFKSVYGNCVERLEELGLNFPALELGLSADTFLADRLQELNKISFLSNSDAHSLPKIAREYNAFRLAKPDFDHLAKALQGDNDNHIIANYGLDPRLGKYHRTYCLECNSVVQVQPPMLRCLECDTDHVVIGVLDRVTYIADYEKPIHPPRRPHYIHQVPLDFIPGVGPKTLEKLLAAFGTEMRILHDATFEEITMVVGRTIAKRVLAARSGQLSMTVGGGGQYGRIHREVQEGSNH